MYKQNPIENKRFNSMELSAQRSGITLPKLETVTTTKSLQECSIL